jgi:hypothetical protein
MLDWLSAELAGVALLFAFAIGSQFIFIFFKVRGFTSDR